MAYSVTRPTLFGPFIILGAVFNLPVTPLVVVKLELDAGGMTVENLFVLSLKSNIYRE